jgi:hypothetical protein
MVAVPAGYDDLLERALYGHLATTRPDGSVQVSPMRCGTEVTAQGL